MKQSTQLSIQSQTGGEVSSQSAQVQALIKQVEDNRLLKSLKQGTAYLELIPKSVAKAQEGVQLSVIKRHEKAVLELCLLKLISDVSSMHGQDWKGEVMVRLIDQIVTDYWFMKFEEIAMVINRPHKVYGALKPMDLINWLNEYDDERTAYFEGESTKYKESYEKQLDEMHRKDIIKDREDLNNEIKKAEFRQIAKRVVDNR